MSAPPLRDTCIYRSRRCPGCASRAEHLDRKTERESLARVTYTPAPLVNDETAAICDLVGGGIEPDPLRPGVVRLVCDNPTINPPALHQAGAPQRSMFQPGELQTATGGRCPVCHKPLDRGPVQRSMLQDAAPELHAACLASLQDRERRG